MFLTDEKGRNISMRIVDNDSTYYITIGIESEGFEKRCLETKMMKVCTMWSDVGECLVWDEVDVCNKWELIPRGFSNIS